VVETPVPIPNTVEAVSKPLRKGVRHILLRKLRKMSQTPAVLKLLLVKHPGPMIVRDDDT
jgi:hypothetical protein